MSREDVEPVVPRIQSYELQLAYRAFCCGEQLVILSLLQLLILGSFVCAGVRWEHAKKVIFPSDSLLEQLEEQI